MTYDQKIFGQLRSDFEMLRTIIRQTKQPDLVVDLSGIEEMIHHRIPDALKHHAPPDFHILFTDFKAEYERFKDFILFDKLIGKHTVALGGGFSSGKSSFLNAWMKKNVLPADIDPSTSVPTYIVSGPEHQVQGINIFDTKVDLELKAIRRISHGFGKIEDEDPEDGSGTVTDSVTLGHIMSSIFLSTPLHRYEHIAFLDTPGYSKPDDKNYSAKTDEQIARSHLNASHFILWFIQADAGTITEEDLAFIRTLRPDIPKLIIVNKADKKPDGELRDIIAKTKKVLDLKGVAYVDVLAYSTKEPNGYDSEAIARLLEGWNGQIYESHFARNFKTIFFRCKQYYETELEQESRRLNRLNKAKTLTDDNTVVECLDTVIADIQRSTAAVRKTMQELQVLQTSFFTEIKYVADVVGIAMPEPSEIELLQDHAHDPLQLLREYKKKKGITSKRNTLHLLQEVFADVKPVIDKCPGGSRYVEQLAGVIRTNCVIKSDQIHIHDMLHTDKRYASIFSELIAATNEQ